MGYIGMCGPKGCGFLPVFVINRVSILISNRVWFSPSSLVLVMIFWKKLSYLKKSI